MLSGRGEALAKLLLAAGGVLFALALGELFLRIDDYRPALVLHPIEWNGRRYLFREAPDRLRELSHAVVFLGDSFTESAACPLDRAYPGAVAELSKTRGMELETRNLGVGGKGAFYYAALAEDLLAAGARPRAAVVTLFENDIELDCDACRFLGELQGAAELSEAERADLARRCAACAAPGAPSAADRIDLGLHEASYVWRLFRRSAAGLLVAMDWNLAWMARRDRKWADPGGLPFRMMERALARTAASFRAAGVPAIAVLYPSVVRLRADEPFVAFYDRAAADLERSSGMMVRSGYPAFLGRPGVKRDMGYSITDGHPSCEANAIFAAWTLEQLGELLDLRPGSQKRASP